MHKERREERGEGAYLQMFVALYDVINADQDCQQIPKTLEDEPQMRRLETRSIQCFAIVNKRCQILHDIHN